MDIMSEVYTAIVLQGGGALGAYEYGVMKELFESRGPDFKPAVITGISIGAINAAMLAGAEKPIETLDHIWREIFTIPVPMPDFIGRAYESFVPQETQQLFSKMGNEGMFRFRPEYYLYPLAAPFITSSIYDTAPLRDTLHKYLDLNRLNNYCQVVVTAINVETGRLAKFGNAKSITANNGNYDNEQSLSIEHILASASLPPGFPMTVIKNRCYWDGGLYSNTPLSEAINCLERCGECSRDVKRELIIAELVPMEGDKPKNLEEVMSRFFNIVFASKLELDTKLFSNYSDFVDLVEYIEILIETIEGDEVLRNKINQTLASRSRDFTIDKIRNHRGLKQLLEHRRIDAFVRIPFTAGPELRNATDFSKASTEGRIEAGQQEAKKQNVKDRHFLAKH
jgi:NTE family protein